MSNALEEWQYRINANEVVNEVLESLLSRYQICLEATMKERERERQRERERERDFVFDSVQLLYCKCHKISFERGGSYNDSPDWIKKEKNNNKSKK